MTKKVNFVLGFVPVFVIVASLVGFDWATSAQTPANQNQSANTNAQAGPAPEAPPTTKKRRASAKKTAPDAAATATGQENANTGTVTTETQGNENSMQSTGSTSTRRKRGRSMQSTVTAQTTSAAEQTDLSGTYSGVMNCPDASMTGDTTLTVTGNKFTLSDGRSGTISAATTHGYTAVAMRFDDAATAGAMAGQASTGTPRTLSFRGRKTGDRLTLSPVPGGAECSFKPAGSMARSRKGKGSRRAMQPAPTGEQVTNPAAAPTATETPANPAPSPSPSPTPPPRQ